MVLNDRENIACHEGTSSDPPPSLGGEFFAGCLALEGRAAVRYYHTGKWLEKQGQFCKKERDSCKVTFDAAAQPLPG